MELRLVSENPNPIKTPETKRLEKVSYYLPPEKRWRVIYQSRLQRGKKYPRRPIRWAERHY